MKRGTVPTYGRDSPGKALFVMTLADGYMARIVMESNAQTRAGICTRRTKDSVFGIFLVYCPNNGRPTVAGAAD